MKQAAFMAVIFSISASLVWAQEEVRFAIYAPDSFLTDALRDDILFAEEWKEIDQSPIFVAPEVPYTTVLNEGLADIVYVSTIIAETGALNPIGFSDLLVQPFVTAAPGGAGKGMGEPYREQLLTDLEHENGYPLALASMGSSSLVSRFELESIDAVRGMKWALAGPSDRGLENLGVSPLRIAQANIQDSLSERNTETADAAEVLIPEDVERLAAVLDVGSVLTRFQSIVMAAIVRDEVWDNMSEAQRIGIEEILLRAEEQSFGRAEEVIGSLEAELAERGVAQIVSFGEFLQPELITQMRESWASQEDSNSLILELYDATVETASEPEGASRQPAGPKDRQGEGLERKIWFATDRDRVPSAQSVARAFGNKRSPGADHPYHCGEISWAHDPARTIGDPIEEGVKFEGPVRDGTNCLDLFEAMSEVGEKRALLFVHGYRNSFADAAGRAAALKEDLDWGSPIIIWSWPSRGRVHAYMSDGEAIRRSRWQLIQFLRELEAAGLSRIDVVAHSMGGRLGIEVLLFADDDRPNPFARTIFVAPDVAVLDFHGAFLASNNSGGVALYVNRHDHALNLSQVRNGGERRAGQAGDDVLRMNGLETVDASEIDFEDGNNHSYSFDVAEGLADLSERLANDDPAPGQRNLRREPQHGYPFHWMIEPSPRIKASNP